MKREPGCLNPAGGVPSNCRQRLGAKARGLSGFERERKGKKGLKEPKGKNEKDGDDSATSRQITLAPPCSEGTDRGSIPGRWAETSVGWRSTEEVVGTPTKGRTGLAENAAGRANKMTSGPSNKSRGKRNGAAGREAGASNQQRKHPVSPNIPPFLACVCVDVCARARLCGSFSNDFGNFYLRNPHS